MKNSKLLFCPFFFFFFFDIKGGYSNIMLNFRKVKEHIYQGSLSNGFVEMDFFQGGFP